MANTIHVDVVSAEESIFSGEATFVALPGEAGGLPGLTRAQSCRRSCSRPITCSAIASDEVAAGDGALRTCRIRREPVITKSSTRVPSRASA